ncbi:hypothetical protein [Nocardia thraciensis]
MPVGYGRQLMADRIGLRTVPEERAVLLDGRDLDPPEVEYLRTAGTNRAGPWSWTGTRTR